MPTITSFVFTDLDGTEMVNLMVQYPDGHTVVYSPDDPNYATLLEQTEPTIQ